MRPNHLVADSHSAACNQDSRKGSAVHQTQAIPLCNTSKQNCSPSVLKQGQGLHQGSIGSPHSSAWGLRTVLHYHAFHVYWCRSDPVSPSLFVRTLFCCLYGMLLSLSNTSLISSPRETDSSPSSRNETFNFHPDNQHIPCSQQEHCFPGEHVTHPSRVSLKMTTRNVGKKIFHRLWSWTHLWPEMTF